MKETPIDFTAPPPNELADLSRWQLEDGRSNEAAYHTYLLTLRLVVREHERLLNGPVVERYEINEGCEEEISERRSRKVQSTEKVTSAFTTSVASKLTASVTGEASAGVDVGAAKLGSKLASALASELSEAWTTTAGHEATASIEQLEETGKKSTMKGVAGKVMVVTVYQVVRHVEYELRLVGLSRFEIRTKKEWVVKTDTEVLSTNSPHIDLVVGTAHAYMPEHANRHTVLKTWDGTKWVLESPAYEPEVDDGPAVRAEVEQSDIQREVLKAFDMDERVKKAVHQAVKTAVKTAKRDAGAARKQRAKALLEAAKAPAALPPHPQALARVVRGGGVAQGGGGARVTPPGAPRARAQSPATAPRARSSAKAPRAQRAAKAPAAASRTPAKRVAKAPAAASRAPAKRAAVQIKPSRGKPTQGKRSF